jgi:hypothetical protein
MSTELATTGSSNPLAELMGEPKQDTKPRSTLARVSILSTAIKGEIELGGKKIKTDVVPVGSYKITLGDDVFYAESVEVRLLADRYQFQRWNSTTNEMEKSVMSRSTSTDLQDSTGGYNLGRPSGYIEDWNSLPEATKEIIRSAKRVKIFMGVLTVKNPLDDTGTPTSGEYTEIPFVMDVKNQDSLKSLAATQKAIERKNVLPYMAKIVLRGEEASIPTGATYGYITSSVGDILQHSDEDSAYMTSTAADFLDYISYSNGKILDLHNERSNTSMSKEDADLVGSIIDVEEAAY